MIAVVVIGVVDESRFRARLEMGEAFVDQHVRAPDDLWLFLFIVDQCLNEWLCRDFQYVHGQRLFPSVQTMDPAYSARGIGGRSSLDLPPQAPGTDTWRSSFSARQVGQLCRGSPWNGAMSQTKANHMCHEILHLSIRAAFSLSLIHAVLISLYFERLWLKRVPHWLIPLAFIRYPERSLIFESYSFRWKINSHTIKVGWLFQGRMFASLILGGL